jgi:hypothetical protein
MPGSRPARVKGQSMHPPGFLVAAQIYSLFFRYLRHGFLSSKMTAKVETFPDYRKPRIMASSKAALDRIKI